jgi:rhamnogalacturonan endolyase
VTGTPLLEAYKLDGTLMWRINLGINIRDGAHYTQFMVYDLDGDGKAEVMCKTADGTWDGTGKVIGDKDKDWRDMDPSSRLYGKIEDGPEYLTVFNGETGAAMATVPYIPGRDPKDGWGGIGGNGGTDGGGNRNDRFLACIAYLDGVHPSAVFCRGYYGRSVLAAWDWRDGKLTSRWVFDSGVSYPPFTDASKFSGQGAHSVSVADVDGDGKDEIVYHSMVVDDNGKGLFSTGLRHGDALHVGDLNPNRPGLEVYGIHENEDDTTRFGTPGIAEYDAKTGEIIWSAGPGVDVGRGVSADIDPRTLGDEMWGGPGGLYDCNGKDLGPKPQSQNFAIWWDGDLLRELLDRNRITKWDWNNGKENPIFTAEGCQSNNGSKATPALTADLFGDWREEVMFRTDDGKHLRIYTTTIPTEHRIYTLMHDPQYRLAVAWQNVAYNQPPHTGFYLGDGMKPAPKPNIVLIGKGEAIAGVKGM